MKRNHRIKSPYFLAITKNGHLAGLICLSSEQTNGDQSGTSN